MMFITGPLYSGKRTFARNFRGSVIADVQDAAAETQTPEQLETLARELAEYDIVIATEVGGGVVPMDAEERAGREAAGRLACLLAAPLLKSNRQKIAELEQLYSASLPQARQSDASERRPLPLPDSWLQAR